MERSEILTAVHEVFSEILPDYESSRVSEDSPLSDVAPSVDSITISELILGIEDRFEITVPDNAFLPETKISDIVRFVDGRI